MLGEPFPFPISGLHKGFESCCAGTWGKLPSETFCRLLHPCRSHSCQLPKGFDHILSKPSPLQQAQLQLQLLNPSISIWGMHMLTAKGQVVEGKQASLEIK